MFENAENETDRKNRFQKLFKCLFQPDSSVWFVQMVISSIFINNSLELLRLPELCIYLMNCIIHPRTEAEYIKARLETGFEFSYGSSYPRFLLIFTIVTTYSISCPIIAPFGMFVNFSNVFQFIVFFFSRPTVHGVQAPRGSLQHLLPVQQSGHQSEHPREGHHLCVDLFFLSHLAADSTAQLAHWFFGRLQTVKRLHGRLSALPHSPLLRLLQLFVALLKGQLQQFDSLEQCPEATSNEESEES